ncbi:MAG TPA: hypothetical protein VF698_06170, partial [Thermoanaerobaculia bacterium]
MTRRLLLLLCLFAAPLQAHFATRIHFVPNVVRHEQTTAVKVVLGTDGTAAKLLIECISGAKIAMTPTGNGVFVADVPAKDILFGYVPSGANVTMFGKAYRLDAAGSKTDDPPLNMVINVFDQNVPIVPIADLTGRQRVTSRVVNIAVGAYSKLPPANNVTNRFYFHFGGDFYDFLNVVHSAPSFPVNRHHENARSDVQGIGIPVVNVTESYGSAGKLLGVNVFPLVTLFDGGETAAVHELGHQWINHLKGVAGSPHWPLSTMARGVMGFSLGDSLQGGTFPWSFVQTATGWKFKGAAATGEFSDLDLYVMGMLPPEQVGTNLVLAVQNQTPCNDCPIAGAVVPLTVADVIKANGPRIPAAAAAQKSFRVGTVVLSADPLSDEELWVLDYFAARGAASAPVTTGPFKAMSKPFAVATKGLGKLNMALVWPSKFPMISTTSPATLPASG